MAAKVIRLAADFTVPVDVVTEPLGMFANRGKGKSNAAHRLVEQLYHAALPSVVLDVKGDWYGIRSSADGRSPGLPFLIVGGSHGDVPLEPDSGAVWARLISEQRVPTIVDLSQLSKTQARRWVMEFAEELYRVNTEPLLVVVDEADVLIPQRLAAELMRLLGAMEDIAKRGRQRGLGILVISQRVADVNKSVTDLLETLFLFAVTGSRTRKALLEWIDDHADPEEAKAVIATLSSLDPGDCWAWSPGWLKTLKRIRFIRPETFDSHATPKAGQAARAIKTMADIDLSAVKEQMADTIERAIADDPKRLRQRIVQLERELADARSAAPETIVERIEVPVLDKQLVVRVEQALAPFAGLLGEVQERLTWEVNQHGEVLEFERRLNDRPPVPRARTAGHRPQAGQLDGRRTEERPDPPQRRDARRPTVPGSEALRLPDGERRILTAVAQHPAGVTREQATILTGYKRSTRDAYIQRLRGRDLAEIVGGLIVATTTGIEALGDDFEPLPTGAALRDHWLRELPEGEARILTLLLEAYPRPVEREDLSEGSGYKRSTRDAYIQRLRTRALVTIAAGGAPRAADTLFD